MLQKEITITLQPVKDGDQPHDVAVNLCYCFATEIAYKDLSGEDISMFFKDAASDVSQERMPDTKRIIFVILSAMIAFEQATGKKQEVTDQDLMTRTTPEGLSVALGTIIGLRTKFYHVPDGEPEEKDGGKSKNA